MSHDTLRDKASSWGQVVGADALELLNRSGQLLATSFEGLPRLVEGAGARRLLLVIDRDVDRACNLSSKLQVLLSGQPFCRFDAFAPNPTSVHAAAAARAGADFEADAVLAIGGGSALDVGKLAALAIHAPRRADALVSGEGLEHVQPTPIIAVPTTSGTGSESTHFAAVYVNGRKRSVAHPGMRPTAVCLDVNLHMSMPPRLAAVTGLDALAQAMESLWAVGSTGSSRRFASVAGRLAGRHLVCSVQNADRENRLAMMVAAHLAGQAINISKTTAAHALSYAMTTNFGLPHGLAVALTLGHIAAWNAGATAEDCLDERGVAHSIHQCGLAAAFLGMGIDRVPEAMRQLLHSLDLPATMDEAGIPEDALPELAASVDPVRLGNNPRRLSPEDIRSILAAAHSPTCEAERG